VILYSISQFSETFSILLIPFFMKRFGIKKVVVIAAVAWFLRFGLLGMGNPGSGAWMFVLSMVIYGVAFDFFNISGSLFINQTTDTKMRSSAQGMFLLMTNGFGATIGSLAAQAVVNAHTAADGSVQWAECWYVFAVYALIVGVAFHFLFHPEKKEALL
jgi:NHS family nucleoside permease-like MFS transporter